MFVTLDFWLWIAQIALAFIFGFAGLIKSIRPLPALAAMGLGYVDDYPAAVTRFAGYTEVLGAIGMILPMATGILPWLTPLAALGFAIIQVLAIGVHARRNEIFPILPFNLLLLGLSLFVLWGRWDLFAAA
jgi:hypothetical protein